MNKWQSNPACNFFLLHCSLLAGNVTLLNVYCIWGSFSLLMLFLFSLVFVFSDKKNNNKTTRKDNPKTKNPTGPLILQHRIKELQGVGWDVYLGKQSASNQTSSRGKGKGCLEIESFPGCLSWDVDVKCYVSAILEISSHLRSKQLFPLINHACTG